MSDYPKFYVKPFYPRDDNGNPAREPSGYDVWEETEKHAVVIAPCDTKEEAERECLRIEATAGGKNVYWRNAVRPIRDVGALWVDANKAVCYWSGHEGVEAQTTLRLWAKEDLCKG